MLRRIFGPNRDEKTGEWRKLHSEELNNMYSSPTFVRDDEIEKTEMGRAYSAYEGGERHVQCFGGEV
jgi:hypothetical protein